MTIQRLACTFVAAGAVSAGLLSGSAAIAAAEPAPPCLFDHCQGSGGPPQGPGGPQQGPGGPQQGPGGPPQGPGGPPQGPGAPPFIPWARGFDRARIDHQPFNYQGAWVTPIFNPDFGNWGFWFLRNWIPL